MATKSVQTNASLSHQFRPTTPLAFQLSFVSFNFTWESPMDQMVTCHPKIHMNIRYMVPKNETTRRWTMIFRLAHWKYQFMWLRYIYRKLVKNKNKKKQYMTYKNRLVWYAINDLFKIELTRAKKLPPNPLPWPADQSRGVDWENFLPGELFFWASCLRSGETIPGFFQTFMAYQMCSAHVVDGFNRLS